jgi:hypothetical protein
MDTPRAPLSQPFDPSRDNSGLDDFAPPTIHTNSIGSESESESEFRPATDPKSERIVLPESTSRGDAVYHLAQKVPSNEFGLPLWFYRSDLLPPVDQLTGYGVDAAAEGLFYHDGYPVTQYGTSFWNQLPHEPYDTFNAFMKFLDQAQELGIRQLDLLSAQMEGTSLEQLQQFYREFYWSARARAYDLFIVAAERKKREYRIRGMEDDHFSRSAKLLDDLLAKFQNKDWVGELNAKEAVEVLESLVKIQRLSVGLTGQHASSNAGTPNQPGASGEFILRQITKGVTLGNGGDNPFGQKLEQLLQDPESGMMLQELILRVNTNDSQMQGASF